MITPQHTYIYADWTMGRSGEKANDLLVWGQVHKHGNAVVTVTLLCHIYTSWQAQQQFSGFCTITTACCSSRVQFTGCGGGDIGRVVLVGYGGGDIGRVVLVRYGGGDIGRVVLVR